MWKVAPMSALDSHHRYQNSPDWRFTGGIAERGGATAQKSSAGCAVVTCRVVHQRDREPYLKNAGWLLQQTGGR